MPPPSATAADPLAGAAPGMPHGAHAPHGMPPTSAAGGPDTASAGPGMLAALQALAHEVREATWQRMHLVTLEVRQAGIAITQMVLLATLAALLLCSAWVVLLLGIYMGAVAAGLHWALALLVVLAGNLLAGMAVWYRARSLTVHLTFPATLRMVRGPSPGPAPGAPPHVTPPASAPPASSSRDAPPPQGTPQEPRRDD